MIVTSATLSDILSAYRWWREAWRTCIKPILESGGRLCVEVFDGKSRDQERLVHSCYRDLARDCLLAEMKADADLWKEALKYGFYLATKDDPDLAADWVRRKPRMVPLVDGDGFIMTPIESRGFTKRMYSQYITFVHMIGDTRGVTWSRTSLGREMAEAVPA